MTIADSPARYAAANIHKGIATYSAINLAGLGLMQRIMTV